MRRPYQPLLSLVPEAWVVLGCLTAIGALLVFGASSDLALPFLVLLFLAIRFYADAQPQVESRPRGVLAPADGVVIHRRECHDPVLGREAIRIVLKPRILGGYCLRAPVTGHVAPVGAERASRIRTEDGQDVVVRVTRGLTGSARPVMMPVGERVGQGRRCGLRRLAREIELLVPADSRVEVRLGQQVRSGQTVLATMLKKG